MLTFTLILEHKGLNYLVWNIYAHKGEGYFIPECLQNLSCTDASRRTMSCDVRGILHTENHKELNTCDFKSQDTTKLTCAIADSRTQLSWSVITFFVRMLCLCLALMTPIPSVSHLLFPSL